jgi:ankyrin repeat protein
MDLDRAGRSALHYAAAANDVTDVVGRLAAGDDKDLADRRGYTPLHLAAQNWSVEAAEVLLDAGASVDAVDAYGNTPLATATFNSKGRGELIEILRRHGAEPSHRNKSGISPLELARRIANYDVEQWYADLREG